MSSPSSLFKLLVLSLPLLYSDTKGLDGDGNIIFLTCFRFGTGEGFFVWGSGGAPPIRIGPPPLPPTDASAIGLDNVIFHRAFPLLSDPILEKESFSALSDQAFRRLLNPPLIVVSAVLLLMVSRSL